MLNAHGTYPFDGDRWQRVKNLEPEEGMKLANVDEKTKALFPNHYPWINKGYIILGAPPMEGNGFSLTFMEMICEGEVGLKGIPAGTKAVYIHDGSFMLIERKALASKYRCTCKCGCSKSQAPGSNLCTDCRNGDHS